MERKKIITMKKSILLLLCSIFLFVTSCKEVDKLTHFNMDYDSHTTIPATFGINLPIDVWTPDIPTNSTTTFESNDTRKDLIEVIVLKKMKLTITSPESASWDFLKTIEIYISADGSEEKKIAWLENIPQNGAKVIDLETSSDDLKEYIKKDEYKLRTKTVTRQLISQDIEVDINASFYVDAKILGI